MQNSVTVIIAAYNAGATIGRAIRSALAEPEIAEIIVVDDASSDDTVAQARLADDGSGRLKILAQEKNAGPSAARNRAIAESAAPWIGILDADDFLLPGRMAGLLAHADNHDFIADDLYQVPEQDVDGPRRLLLGAESLPAPRPVGFTDFVLSNVTRKGRTRGELGFIKPIMQREFLAQHNLRYREDMRLGEDYELYARALALGARLILLPAQGYVSVVRPNSLSGLHSEKDLLGLRDCNKAMADRLPLSPEQKSALRQSYLSTDCRLQWRLLILAVKHRDFKAALATFMRPWPVPAYLIGQLSDQAWLRARRRLKRANP